jgi:hypothetical protein
LLLRSFARIRFYQSCASSYHFCSISLHHKLRKQLTYYIRFLILILCFLPYLAPVPHLLLLFLTRVHRACSHCTRCKQDCLINNKLPAWTGKRGSLFRIFCHLIENLLKASDYLPQWVPLCRFQVDTVTVFREVGVSSSNQIWWFSYLKLEEWDFFSLCNKPC